VVQVAVPINTLINGFVTLVGAATAHQCIDEGIDSADDNTTYFRDVTGVKVFQGLCTSSSAPEPGDIQWRVRIRDRIPGLAQSNWLIQMGSATDGIVGARVASAPVSGNWITYTYTLTTAERANLTSYTNLALRIVLQNTTAAWSGCTAADIILPDALPFSPTWWDNWARL